MFAKVFFRKRIIVRNFLSFERRSIPVNFARRRAQRRRRLAMLASLSLAGLAAPSAVVAHPHILASVRLDLTREQTGKFSAVRSYWTYDPGYAAFAMRDIDKDRDGKASKGELQSFAAAQIKALGEFGYFTSASAGKHKLRFSKPSSVVLEKSGEGNLRLNFHLAILNPAIKGPLAIQVFDPNFFAYFTVPEDKDAVRVIGNSAGCVTKVVGPKAIDLKHTRSIPKAFWAALDGSRAEADQFANRVTVSCA